MSTPRVSVIVPTFGRPDLLERAIESVRSQTFASWELIVVDDNPADSTARRQTEHVMARYRTDARILYRAQPSNRGASAARNRGIREARGDLVGLLDDDDAWLPERLSAQVSAFSDDRVVAAACGWTLEHEDAVVSVRAPRLPDEDDPGFHTNRIGPTSVTLFRREALVAAGMFDEALASRQDLDTYFRVLSLGTFHIDERPLVRYRIHHDSISSNLEAVIRGREQFLDRHRDSIAAVPLHHARYVEKSADLYAEAGRIGIALKTYLRSLRIRFRPKLVAKMALAVVGIRKRSSRGPGVDMGS